MHDKQILYESEHLLVVGLQNLLQPDETVFVTFNELGFVPDGPVFWGEDLFATLPHSAIGIVSKYPNWYPAADMQAALPSILAAIRGRPVITYGYSQGGYGALKYAAALNAQAALSFCPQWSINPDDVSEFDRRFAVYFAPHLDNGHAIDAGDAIPNAFVFFDPYQRHDVMNIERIGGCMSLQPVICPFTGHDTIRLLSETHLGVTFLALADRCLRSGAAAESTARELRRLLRTGRGQSSYYFMHRSAVLERGQKLHLLTCAQKAGSDRISGQARLMLAVHRHDTAEVERLLLSLPFESIKAYGLIKAWHHNRKMQFESAERRLMDLIIIHCAGQPLVLLHAVNSLIKLGMREEAAKLLTDIVAEFGVEGDRISHHVLNYAKALKLPRMQLMAEESRRRQAQAAP